MLISVIFKSIISLRLVSEVKFLIFQWKNIFKQKIKAVLLCDYVYFMKKNTPSNNDEISRGVGIRYWDAYNILKQRFASEDSSVSISVQRFFIFYCGLLLLVNGTWIRSTVCHHKSLLIGTGLCVFYVHTFTYNKKTC